MYKVDPDKIKITFNNIRSLHKHLKDIEFEPNVLAPVVIGFAESRLCKRDENVQFALKRFRLIRLDDTGSESVKRTHRGLALYIKEYFHFQKLIKLHCKSSEFIVAAMHSIQIGYFQVVILYRYPNPSRTDFKNDIRCHLRPVFDLTTQLVILVDINMQINCVNSAFVDFMETLFSCVQQIKQSTTDSGSTIDLIFANRQALKILPM